MMSTAATTRAPAEGRRWRVRWGRVVLWVVAVDMGVTAGISGWHYLLLRHQEAALAQHIAIVQQQSRVLRQEVQALRSPTQLKAILTGREKIPNPLWLNN